MNQLIIGYVTQIKGVFFAQAENSEDKRLLKVGDPIYLNEVVSGESA